MSVQPPSENSFLIENELFTDKTFEEFLTTFQDKYNTMVYNLNRKDYGYYTKIPILCGQLRFDRDDVKSIKDVYRVVVDIGTLKDTNISQIAHGITFDANTEVIRLYGIANDPGTDAIPIENPMILSIDPTYINITTVDDKTMYTTCTVTIEYIGG